MTSNQQFILAVLTLLVPLIGSVITIIGGVILFNQQSKKLGEVKASADNAAKKSEAAEVAANHSKEAAAALRADFKSTVAALNAAPQEPAKVEVVNVEPVPVVVAETK